MKKPNLLALGLSSALLAVACSTAPKSTEARSDLLAKAETALDEATAKDPTLEPVLNSSAGYAVFPNIGKGGVIVGGAYGKGVLYERGRMVGYCDLTQGSIGAQLGGQAFTEIVVFETEDALQRFKTDEYSFNAQATAVAVRSGAARNARFENGVAVFITAQSGLMAEASVGGQKVRYRPMSDEDEARARDASTTNANGTRR